MTIFNLINNQKLVKAAFYIDGKWLSEAKTLKTFEVNNPVDGKIIATLPDMGKYETELAIEAAYKAQKSWAKETAKNRSIIIKKWYDLIIENAEDLAKIITIEMGKPLAESKGEILYAASFVEWFAEEAKRIYGDIIPGHLKNVRINVIKQPIGVVGAITPWNFPVAMITRKISPALAAGCTTVTKPAEISPLSAIALAILAEDAGFPKGVINILSGLNSSEIGQEICSNDKIRKITFTGSTNVGKILMRQCADQVKKVSLELGGNAPFIVFDDADIDAAVDGAILSKYRNAGQTCVCANRIFVQDKIYDNFSQKLAEKVKTFKLGNGLDEGVTIGPLINEAGLEKVKRHIKDAKNKGANIIMGGKVSSLDGLFFEPTIICNVNPDMLVAREETFGPVAPIFKFSDVDEVIKLANSTEFGLASYFYAKDLGKVYKVAEELEFGIVGINTGIISTEVAPFGGVKQSGLGREGSKYGIDDFIEIKYLCIAGMDG